MEKTLIDFINEGIEQYIKENCLCLTEEEKVLVRLAFIEGATVGINYHLQNKGE